MSIILLIAIIYVCYFIFRNYGYEILSKFSETYKQKIEEREYRCTSLYKEIGLAFEEMCLFLSPSDSFLDLNESQKILEKYRFLYNQICFENYSDLKRSTDYAKLTATKHLFINKYNDFSRLVSAHNENIYRKQLADAYKIVGNVEGSKLDEQQMMCILKVANSHLVIAGAGTGKTTTIIGKIKFLLNKGICDPDEILVLSFTKASATEMRERIIKETKQSIDAQTFHKLGLEIIKNVEGIVPNRTQIELSSFIKKRLPTLMGQTDYLEKLSRYLLFYGVVAKSEFEFASQKEYDEYLKCNPPTTFKNELVKSYGELDIANFLTQNGITYEYETAYIIDTRTSEYGQYHPDFFLPEYNIYIEYFGINSNGEVPAYFNKKFGKSASETYQDSMNWKRQLHKEHNTIMIECFFYEKLSGNLFKSLEGKLKEYNVIFNTKSPKEVFNELEENDKSLLEGFSQLAGTIINLLRSNAYTIKQVRNMIPTNVISSSSNLLILDLIEPIYDAYSQELIKKGEIDFNDMINKATKYVRERKYIHKYKYVIVDEYQDISKSRFSLLKAMRDTRDYSLFCVGDDWQSIYRFAGSDIGFILNFIDYWGISEISKIETTYRFAQTLIDVSSDFIMKNPNQVKKLIQGSQINRFFPIEEINGYNENYLADLLAERLKDLPQSSTVFFIGRYKFDIDYIKNNVNFSCNYDNLEQCTRVIFQQRRDLEITFLTVHKSKGLQADYVFIVNNKKSRMGFPSKMQDAPILELLLEDSDDYPYSEERRLFYVALTRTKKKVFLLTLKDKESVFAMELKDSYGKEMEREKFTCPLCRGHLSKKTGPYSIFLGCSNWKKGNGCKYTRILKKK